jgi:hypothetical protein
MGTLNTKYLHYQKLPRSFFGEISDLPNAQIPMESLLSEGVQGVGFWLESQNTGDKILMQAVRSEFDKAGEEIVAYIFEPVNDDRIKEVILLND